MNIHSSYLFDQEDSGKSDPDSLLRHDHLPPIHFSSLPPALVPDGCFALIQSSLTLKAIRYSGHTLSIT